MFSSPILRSVLVGLSLLIFSQGSRGADITRQVSADSHIDVIVLSGVILPSDQSNFASVAAATGNAVVVLNSQGGATLAAIEIGRAIRLRGFATMVPENALCASACALIWLSGNPRFTGEGSRIGFHASYIDRNGKLIESGVANALVGAYLNQLGLSQQAIFFVTSAPPEGMEWLDARKAQSIGVDFISLEQHHKTSDQPSIKSPVVVERYDPISTVTKFYDALSAADGDIAAALVIPEKRGIGPFNEVNIWNFFGHMRERLQLQSIKLLEYNVVAVKYRYVHASGRTCNGRAEVTTEYIFGKTLIEKIKANC